VYAAPETVEETVAVLGEHGADGKVLAGGQSLIPMANMRLARPSMLVDLRRVDELSGIEVGDEVVIGAMTRQAAVLRDPDVTREAQLVVAALRHVGHPANRTRGTFGGSIAHADPAAELPAVILAMDASLVVRGPGGERVVKADDFFVTYYSTDIQADEVLTEVRLPRMVDRVWGFEEVARRRGDFAMAGVAFTATLAGGRITDPRVVLFGVADRPVRAREAEKSLIGRVLGEASAREAGQLAVNGIDFASDSHVPDAYRKDATVALVARAVLQSANHGGNLT
jgi:carbon-monoxide dehydrogenase medium subunit